MTEARVKSAIAADNDSVVAEIHISAPPQRVFQALTNASELGRWFNSSGCPVKLWEMDARLGGRYGYATEKGTVVVNGVREFECYGEILEIDPPRVLAYTWIANWHADKSRRTVVRWELTPDASGTLAKVTHSGLAQEDVARKDYSGGWLGVLEQLRKFSEQKPGFKEYLSLI